MAKRVAVIGAGPAGCLAAYRLARAGNEVVLFEKEEAPGGRTRSWRRNGLLIDTGAAFFTNFYPLLDRVIDELGLSGQKLAMPHTSALCRQGQSAEMNLGSVASFLRFPFLSPADKIRMAGYTAWATLRHHGLDLAEPASLARWDDRSIAAHARDLLGGNLYHHLVRPGIEPFWYFSCEDVSRSIFLALLARAATARFFCLSSGMDAFCLAMADTLETRLATPVTSITSSGSGLRVSWEHGEEGFDQAVLATTASAALALTRNLPDSTISPFCRNFLQSQQYVSSVHAAYTTEKSSCPPGWSAVFPCGPEAHRLACVAFNSHKKQSPGLPPDRELISVYLSSHGSRGLLDKSRDEILQYCWTAARDIWPQAPDSFEPLFAIARPEVIPLHAPGRYRMAARFWREQKGPLAFAGDYLATATMEGALRSGEKAAEILMR